MSGRWGPDGQRAAVSLSFDNLGEASDLEFSRWPRERPVGQHHSVLEDLPAILEALNGSGGLGGVGAKATFFVESWNLPVYPAAIAAIVDGGHEVACHGMRHEMWGLLSADQERDHITRCLRDFARHGLELRGLRPPGGALAPVSAQVLSDAGLRYVSPVSVPSGVLENGLVILECDLGAADVAFYSPSFTRHRRYEPGDELLGPVDLVVAIMAEVERVIAAGGYLALLFHPHLQTRDGGGADSAKIEAIAEIVRRLASDSRLWFDRCDAVADWMGEHRTDFPPPPSLDPPAWWDPSVYQNLTRNHP